MSESVHLYDRKTLDRLLDLGGTEILEELSALYFAQTESSLVAARAAARQGDTLTVADHVHRLAGGGVNLGLKALSKYALQVELELRAGRSADMMDMLDELEAASTRDRAYLESILARR